MAKPVLLQIFHARWAEYMQIEQQNVRTSSAGNQWVDGIECGEKLVKICKNNAVSLTGFVNNGMRIDNTSQWDVSLLTAVIPAVTKAIQKSKHFDF